MRKCTVQLENDKTFLNINNFSLVGRNKPFEDKWGYFALKTNLGLSDSGLLLSFTL